MHAGRTGALAAAGGRKDAAKAKDEAERAKIAAALDAIYGRAKSEVTAILDGLGPKVDAAFTAGEQAARARFENYVAREMARYKDRRYSGVGGVFNRVGDWATGLPDEVNVFYQRGRAAYLREMGAVIDGVADLVGGELTRAKARIAQGRREVDAHLRGLAPSLQRLGREAAGAMQDRFDALAQDVDAKQDEVAQGIAQKYSEAVKAVDERVAAMKAENRGAVAAVKDAVGGVIRTILQLKDMLLGVLARAAGVIDTIIKDPIGFLGNLVSAVRLGLNNFVGNIGAHLKNGLMGWLFGALAQAGIQMPAALDLKGVLHLVMQLLGLTYANLRARAVGVVGERTVALLEKTVDVFKILVSEGPAGLWRLLADRLAGLKDQVMEQIRGFVVTRVITAGVTWLVSMLNPASAFVKACKAIYDVVMFFVERGSQVMGLVNAVLDSVGAIAGGAISGAARLVENALARALPVAISFLASLLGLGGISEKIKGVLATIQAPVNKMVDGLVMGAVKGFKKLGGDRLLAAADRGVTWAKGKVRQGVAWAKAKVAQAKDWVKGRARGAAAWAKGKLGIGGTEEDKQKRLVDGVRAGVAAVERLRGGRVTAGAITPVLGALRMRHRLGVLRPVVQDGMWAVHGEIRRMTATTSVPALPYDPRGRSDAELWVDAARATAFPGETPADKDDRVQKARAALKAKYATRPDVVDAMLRQYEGQRPRQFRSVTSEDDLGLGGHIQARHVYASPNNSEGGLIRSPERDLARRAATGTLGGRNSAVRVQSPGKAGAFESAAMADRALKIYFAVKFNPNWTQYRDKLLQDGAIAESFTLGGIPGLSMQNVDKRVAPSPKAGEPIREYNVADVPNYLLVKPTKTAPPVRGARTSGAGRPLYRGDPRMVPAAGVDPLTEPAPLKGVFVRVVADAAAPGGWFVHSAWPE
jgi:hypothetical protein